MYFPERLKQLNDSMYIKAGIVAIAYRLQQHTASFEIAQEGGTALIPPQYAVNENLRLFNDPRLCF